MTNPLITKNNSELTNSIADYAAFLANQIPEIIGIALGGSLSIRKTELDEHSDIDLFCYHKSTQDIISKKVVFTILKSKESLMRKRYNLCEYRDRIKQIDTNIKFFQIDYLRSWVYSNPSLDNQYLEEVESYQNFQIILDTDETLTQLISHSKKQKLENCQILSQLAIERYGKAIWWSIIQGIKRDNWLASYYNLNCAIDSLLNIKYLLESEYPPSLKWRASKSLLINTSNGDLFYKKVLDFYEILSQGNIENSLRKLFLVEKLIVEQCALNDIYLWADNWWWKASACLKLGDQ